MQDSSETVKGDTPAHFNQLWLSVRNFLSAQLSSDSHVQVASGGQEETQGLVDVLASLDKLKEMHDSVENRLLEAAWGGEDSEKERDDAVRPLMCTRSLEQRLRESEGEMQRWKAAAEAAEEALAGKINVASRLDGELREVTERLTDAHQDSTSRQLARHQEQNAALPLPVDERLQALPDRASDPLEQLLVRPTVPGHQVASRFQEADAQQQEVHEGAVGLHPRGDARQQAAGATEEELADHQDTRVVQQVAGQQNTLVDDELGLLAEGIDEVDTMFIESWLSVKTMLDEASAAENEKQRMQREVIALRNERQELMVVIETLMRRVREGDGAAA